MAFFTVIRTRLPLLPRINIAAAAARSFSSGHASAAEEHLTAKYRRRLGIGDSPILLRGVDKEKKWEPPNPGVVKINFNTYVALTKRTPSGEQCEDLYPYLSLLDAHARDSSGVILGFTVASTQNIPKNPFGLQFYALRAAGNLARALKDHGFYEGPVVYESYSEFYELANCLDERCCCDDEREREAFLRFTFPDDVEDVDRGSQIDIGDPDEVIKALDRVNESFKDTGLNYAVGSTDVGGN